MEHAGVAASPSSIARAPGATVSTMSARIAMARSTLLDGFVSE